MFDLQYYLTLKQKIKEKADKAWSKYYRVCNLLGEEYILLNDRLNELQEELKEVEAKEQESKKEDEVKPKETK